MPLMSFAPESAEERIQGTLNFQRSENDDRVEICKSDERLPFFATATQKMPCTDGDYQGRHL
jgi:hypothetical protein